MPGTDLGMSLTSSYFTYIYFNERINIRGHFYFHLTVEETELGLPVCVFILLTC